jgi:hypothetical protein
VNVEDRGIWLASFDDIANDGGTRTLGQFGDLDEAIRRHQPRADTRDDLHPLWAAGGLREVADGVVGR